ncbi:DUF2218 domain-containing protein [Streptacidiphilus sp. PAMC 29251]
MSRSEARVSTERPHRYAKQLASHFGRKLETTWDEETGLGSLVFSTGTAVLAAQPGVLLLTVEGEPENIENLEGVVGRHLVRFGTKDELVAEWHRDSGEAGTVQRNEEEVPAHAPGSEA